MASGNCHRRGRPAPQNYSYGFRFLVSGFRKIGFRGRAVPAVGSLLVGGPPCLPKLANCSDLNFSLVPKFNLETREYSFRGSNILAQRTWRSALRGLIINREKPATNRNFHGFLVTCGSGTFV